MRVIVITNELADQLVRDGHSFRSIVNRPLSPIKTPLFDKRNEQLADKVKQGG